LPGTVLSTRKIQSTRFSRPGSFAELVSTSCCRTVPIDRINPSLPPLLSLSNQRMKRYYPINAYPVYTNPPRRASVIGSMRMRINVQRLSVFFSAPGPSSRSLNLGKTEKKSGSIHKNRDAHIELGHNEGSENIPTPCSSR
jgi:hypothetical protein